MGAPCEVHLHIYGWEQLRQSSCGRFASAKVCIVDQKWFIFCLHRERELCYAATMQMYGFGGLCRYKVQLKIPIRGVMDELYT